MRALFTSIRAARFGRLLAVLLVAVTAGVLSDWFRTDQRLLFSKPLPAFLPEEPGK